MMDDQIMILILEKVIYLGLFSYPGDLEWLSKSTTLETLLDPVMGFLTHNIIYVHRIIAEAN